LVARTTTTTMKKKRNKKRRLMLLMMMQQCPRNRWPTFGVDSSGDGGPSCFSLPSSLLYLRRRFDEVPTRQKPPMLPATAVPAKPIAARDTSEKGWRSSSKSASLVVALVVDDPGDNHH
jgi:hypothetical protein